MSSTRCSRWITTPPMGTTSRDRVAVKRSVGPGMLARVRPRQTSGDGPSNAQLKTKGV